MAEHTFLVAIVVETDDSCSREEAEKGLHRVLPKPGLGVWTEGLIVAGANPKRLGEIESWWIAEDDRHDGSDNDSAVFVPYSPPQPCLVVFPPNADLEAVCPRCGVHAGEHPAPLALLSDPDAPVFGRPTLREARHS